jgi:N-acetylneuraminate synthase
VPININGTLIGQGYSPFIIAEMSGNHNNSLPRALEIVRAAARAGVSAIKLQTYKPETLTINAKTEDFLVSDKNSPWSGRYLYDLYSEASTPWEWHEKIFAEAQKLGLIYFSSAFDESSVDFLEKLGVPIYKIASFENSHLPLIRKIAKTEKPIIISTGLATLAEIEESVEVARKNGCKDIILLKCTSSYPADPQDCNLNTIKDLKQKFNCEVGFSDHTLGIGSATAAIAIGATVIEKHFTLDSSDNGVDSKFSMSEIQMTQFVQECISACNAQGVINYGPTKNEISSLKFRRSIYAIKDIEVGEILTPLNIGIIRPGFGLHPRFFDLLIGKLSPMNLKYGDRIDENFYDQINDLK